MLCRLEDDIILKHFSLHAAGAVFASTKTCCNIRKKFSGDQLEDGEGELFLVLKG